MKKEIVVNADDLESRVAILEGGQLAELHVEREARIVGSIYKARVVSVLPGMDAAFADVGLDRNVFLCADDVGFVSRDGVTVHPAPRSASISQRLKERQEVVVQIVRAPVGGKGARASTRLAFPGRYLVLMMSHGTQVGISRKIEDRKERDRLRKIGDIIRPKDSGLIIRTEAEGHNREDLETDLKVLLDLRDRVMKKAARTKAPALLHQDLTLVYHVIRDVFTEDVERLVIDEKGVYDNAVELVKLIAPKLRQRIKLYRSKMPIFHKYGIEGEIDRLLRRKVWLGAGGYISIDQAEAFTAIDVNTGRYTGTTGLEDTIFRTNLEAADEVARQLRLRDLGGIIVIDFIDMERARNRDRVMDAFQEALRRDRQRTKILHLSPLGLVEMTRKRRGESLMGILTETCPHCAGLGRVRRPLTVALKLEREACRLAAEDNVAALILRAAPAVAMILVGEDGARATALEKRAGCPVYIRAHYEMGTEEHDLTPTTRAEAQRRAKEYSRAQELTLDRVDPPEAGGGDEEICGWAEGLRLLVDSAPPVEPGAVVVVDEVGRSFGRVHVKGAKPKPAKRERGLAAQARREREAPPQEVREVEPLIGEVSEAEFAPAEEQEAEPRPKPSRRRRGGRRRSRRAPEGAAPAVEAAAPSEVAAEPLAQQPEPAERAPRAARPRRRRRPRSAAPKPPGVGGPAPAEAAAESAVRPAEAAQRPAPRPYRRRRPRTRAPKPPAGQQATPSAQPAEAPAPAPSEGQPKRKVGLLRRGARTIARVSRAEEE
jgi:ribonuclease G